MDAALLSNEAQQWFRAARILKDKEDEWQQQIKERAIPDHFAMTEYALPCFAVPPNCVPIGADVRQFDWKVAVILYSLLESLVSA